LIDALRRLWLERKLGPPVIVVSGLPRSGTSMMMNMLAAAGLPIASDGERAPDEDNPKGYFELERVKELDKTQDKSWVAEHRGRVVKIISFLLKDLPDDCCYRVIFMRRDLQEVVASQNKMLVRRGEAEQGTDDARMIQLYTSHLHKVELLLEERRNFRALDVHYRQVVEAPRAAAASVSRFLGLRLDAERMVRAVDRGLYRNRREGL
jgi:hypothetical protein